MNHTVLFRRGDFIFVTYGLLAASAFVVGAVVASARMGARGLDASSALLFAAFVLLPSVMLGARASSVLLEVPALLRDPLGTLLKPGYMLHGGILGGALAIEAWSSLNHLPILPLLDSWALALPIGEAICRLGCLVYGCCWGRPTKVPWAVRYTNPVAKVLRFHPGLRDVPLHPSQLYASGLHGIQFLALLVVAHGAIPDGLITGLYLISHPPLRFFLERFRDDDRGRLGQRWTHSNLYSAVQFAVGLLVLFRLDGPTFVGPMSQGLVAVGSNPSNYLILALLFLGTASVFGIHLGAVGQWRRPARLLPRVEAGYPIGPLVRMRWPNPTSND